MFILNKVIDYARDHGVLRTLITIGRKIIFEHQKVILITRSLEDPIPEVQSPYNNMTIRRATLFDVKELYQLVKNNNYHRTTKEFSEWIKTDYAFFLAIIENRIIGYRCSSYGVESIPRRFRKAIKLKRDDGWGKDVFIHPSYRGKMISSVLGKKVFNCMKERGYHRIFAYTTPDNLSMRSVGKKGGFKEIKEITYFRVLLFSWRRIKSLD